MTLGKAQPANKILCYVSGKNERNINITCLVLLTKEEIMVAKMVASEAMRSALLRYQPTLGSDENSLIYAIILI